MSAYKEACRLLDLGIAVEAIARSTGLQSKTIREYRWRRANYKRYERNQEAYARRCGERPIAEVRKEHRQHTASRYADMKKLLRKGLSFTEAGEKLGMTRNQIAGVRWRAELRQKKQRNDDREGRKTNAESRA